MAAISIATDFLWGIFMGHFYRAFLSGLLIVPVDGTCRTSLKLLIRGIRLLSTCHRPSRINYGLGLPIYLEINLCADSFFAEGGHS